MGNIKRFAVAFAAVVLASVAVVGTGTTASADGGGATPSNWHCC